MYKSEINVIEMGRKYHILLFDTLSVERKWLRTKKI